MNREWLHRVFRPEFAIRVADIPLLPAPHSDIVIWKLAKDGSFSTKTAY